MRKIIGVLLIFGLAATGFAKINIPGFTFVKQTTEGDLTVELYQNTSGNTVTLRYSGLLSQDLMSKMASWSSTFFRLENDFRRKNTDSGKRQNGRIDCCTDENDRPFNQYHRLFSIGNVLFLR